jgi:hypothetical protein
MPVGEGEEPRVEIGGLVHPVDEDEVVHRVDGPGAEHSVGEHGEHQTRGGHRRPRPEDDGEHILQGGGVSAGYQHQQATGDQGKEQPPEPGARLWARPGDEHCREEDGNPDRRPTIPREPALLPKIESGHGSHQHQPGLDGDFDPDEQGVQGEQSDQGQEQRAGQGVLGIGHGGPARLPIRRRTATQALTCEPRVPSPISGVANPGLAWKPPKRGAVPTC